MNDVFDDIVGTEPKPKAKPKQTKNDGPIISFAQAATGRGLEDVGGVQAMRRPVTITLLATIFDHDPQTITKRLVNCPHVMHGNRRLYDFKEACSYIIKPKMTPEQFVKTLNKADLPPEINLAFWNAQRAKLKYKLEAQEAWETADVLEVFGDAFMTISDTLRTVPEEMRERARLNDEQTKLLEEAIDELRANLSQKLVEMPKQKRTSSILEQPLFGTSKEVDPQRFDEWDDEDSE